MIDVLQRRVAMAAGKEPADIQIINVRVVNVFTGEVESSIVRIGDGAFVGFGDGPAHRVIDAAGRYMLPGLIDAHIHVESSMSSPARFTELVLPHGTTSVVADPHEIVNVAGVDGLHYMLDCAAQLPLNLFIALPSCVPAMPFEDAGAVVTANDLAPLIDNPQVVSIGEMMNFPGVLAGDEEVLRKITLGQAHRKSVDGHAPGLIGHALDAYLSTGIGNTHECSTLEEFHENLRRGSYVLLREGSAAKNLTTLLPGITPANARRCAFCCDDRHAEDLIREGHMDNILRLAVNNGLDPVQAVTLCTLNAAEALNLKGKGAIAPGYDADFVLVDDLREFAVHQTWVAGQCVAQDGQMLLTLPDIPSERLANSMNVAPLNANALNIAVPSGNARVMGMVPRSLVTTVEEQPIKVDSRGYFDPALNPGLVKLAVIERHRATGRMGLAILAGYNLHNGAIATTIAHDSHNIVVAGDNDADMLLAVDALKHMRGGIVICHNGSVAAELPLPIGGLMTNEAPGTITAKLASMLQYARAELGVPADVEPFMTLSFMALPVIPEVKLTTKGLFHVLSGTFLDVAL